LKDTRPVLVRSEGSASCIMTMPAEQGLTLVQFSAQPEPFLTQNAP